jgi:hypothetical protein
VATITVASCNFISPSAAQQPSAKVVGIGAAPCSEFLQSAKANPAVQRDYLAWAQGFMSGVLLTRPAGVDEGLDLSPPTTPLLQQLEFLKTHCTENSSGDFTDAVVALYKKLRNK